MPYCTIEEAWQTSLNPELKMDRNYKGASELGYKDIYLEPSEIYDEKGKPIRNTPVKKKPKKKRLPNMSRTYNRLNEHSGPKSRFKDDNAEKRIVLNKGKHTLDDAQKHPNYDNADLPINDYNNSMYNTLDNEYRDNIKKIEESSMMEDFIGHYRNLYIDDTVYNLPHYTDCHTFDRTRKIMAQQFTDDYYEKKLGDGGTGHIMARCNLIHDYLDHRKGKRKLQKHSPEWLRR